MASTEFYHNTHCQERCPNTTTTGFRERCCGLQRESCLGRVKSDRAPQEEKGLEGEKVCISQRELEQRGTLMAETRAKVILLFLVC